MAFFQRLIADPKIGFNYDYMGYAEFEFGAALRSRMELLKFMQEKTISARRMMLQSSYGVSKTEFPAVIIGEKSFIDSLENPLKVSVHKTPMREHDRDVLAWMTVGDGFHKFVVLRDNKDYATNVDRLEKFLNNLADQMAAADAAAA